MNTLILFVTLGCMLAAEIDLVSAQNGQPNEVYCSNSTETYNHAKIEEITGIWYTYQSLFYAGSSIAFDRSVIDEAQNICAKITLSASTGINYRLSAEYFYQSSTTPYRTDSGTVNPNPGETGKATISSSLRAFNDYTSMLIDLNPKKYMILALCKPEVNRQRLLDIVSITVRQGQTLSNSELEEITTKLNNTLGDPYAIATLKTEC